MYICARWSSLFNFTGKSKCKPDIHIMGSVAYYQTFFPAEVDSLKKKKEEKIPSFH